MTITTPNGTTISLEQKGSDTLVILDNPAAPADMRNTEAGRIIPGGFQAAPFMDFGLRPDVLRAIADLISARKP